MPVPPRRSAIIVPFLVVGAFLLALIGPLAAVRAQDPTSAPDATPSASPSPGASPGAVDLSGVTIRLADLPAGFADLPADLASSFGDIVVGSVPTGPESPGHWQSPWAFWSGDRQNPDLTRTMFVLGAVYHPLNATDLGEIEEGFAHPDVVLEQFSDEFPAPDGAEPARVIGTIGNLGDRALGFVLPTELSGTAMTTVVIIWQRGPAAGAVFAITPTASDAEAVATSAARTVDGRLARALGIGVTAYRGTGPLVPTITTYIPTPLDVSTDPGVVGSNLAFAALAMIVFTIALRLLNSALAEREVRLQRLLRPAVWLGRLQARADAGLERRIGRFADPVRMVGILAFYGLVFSLLDRTWQPLSLTGAALFVQMVVANGLAGIADDIAQWRAARRLGLPATFALRPALALVAVGSTAVSRAASIVPGILIGTPEAFEVQKSTREVAQEDRLVRVGALTLVAVGLGAWLLSAAAELVVRAAPAEGVTVAVAGAESLFVLVFAVTVQNLFAQLLGLPGSTGQLLMRWNRPVWLAAFFGATFLFWHTLVNPRGEVASALQTTNVRVFIATVVVFAVASVAIWGYVRVTGGRAATGPAAAAPSAAIESAAPAVIEPAAPPPQPVPAGTSEVPVSAPTMAAATLAPPTTLATTPPSPVPAVAPAAPTVGPPPAAPAAMAAMAAPATCPACARALTPGTRFCPGCGARLDVGRGPVAVPTTAPQAPLGWPVPQPAPVGWQVAPAVAGTPTFAEFELAAYGSRHLVGHPRLRVGPGVVTFEADWIARGADLRARLYAGLSLLVVLVPPLVVIGTGPPASSDLAAIALLAWFGLAILGLVGATIALAARGRHRYRNVATLPAGSIVAEGVGYNWQLGCLTMLLLSPILGLIITFLLGRKVVRLSGPLEPESGGITTIRLKAHDGDEAAAILGALRAARQAEPSPVTA